MEKKNITFRYLIEQLNFTESVFIDCIDDFSKLSVANMAKLIEVLEIDNPITFFWGKD